MIRYVEFYSEVSTEHLNQTKVEGNTFTFLCGPQRQPLLPLYSAYGSVKHGLDTQFTNVQNKH